jgi:signal transduction histidine kinase
VDECESAVKSCAAHRDAGRDDRRMTADATEALRRCERLLALISEAMEMERAFASRETGLDMSTRSLLRPVLEDALMRLEPLLAQPPVRSLKDWVRELVDLELEVDAVLSRRGWRTIAPDADGPPPMLTDRL